MVIVYEDKKKGYLITLDSLTVDEDTPKDCFNNRMTDLSYNIIPNHRIYTSQLREKIF